MGITRRKAAIAEDHILLGKITKPHALSGEVKFKPFGCDPWVLEEIKQVHIENSNQILEVEYVRGSMAVPVVKFKNIEDRTAAEKIIGSILWIEERVLPQLAEDLYYESDFLYSRVDTISGQNLGRIDDIIPTGECDVFVIHDHQGKEYLLPANRQVIKEFRKVEKLVIVDLLPDYQEYD